MEKRAITVKVYRFAIENGKMNRVPYANVNITPSLSPMTKEEYEEELADIICNTLPPAFQAFVQSQAWERGHSAGYEEVISIARDLTDDLEKALKEFKNGLTKKLEMADGFSQARLIVEEAF